jgi:glyoxylase-like metal-dependent hydrolase (beta-lactamase superfamily II)
VSQSPQGSASAIVYPFEKRPEPGEALEVADGVFWIRMPIPIAGLDFINLWLLRDGEGWTIVDSGYGSDEIRGLWDGIFDRYLDGRPVTRLICTHFHPDHLGLAGWIAGRWDLDLWMTLGEWTFGRMLYLDARSDLPADVEAFYRRIGFDDEALAAFRARGFNQFQKSVTEIPRSFRRIVDGEDFCIGDYSWRVMVGRGHSPEHACLYCQELGLLISGDQVLPRISPHIGVYPGEPDANPLQFYLDSLDIFRPLPEDTLVLPAHNDAFLGLHHRVDSLSHHHDKRLDALLEACATPQKAMDVLPVLFRRKLEGSHVVLAVSESLAHLHYLMGKGVVTRYLGEDGIYRYVCSETEQQRRESAA